MTALSPPLAGRAVAVTLCRTLFTSARIIRQSDRNYRPEAIKLNLLDILGQMERLDGHDASVAGQPTPAASQAKSAERREPNYLAARGPVNAHPHQRLPSTKRAGLLLERQELAASHHAVRAGWRRG